MERLRERLDTDEMYASREKPTKYKTDTNRYGVHCAMCGELYYVDEHTISKVRSAVEVDPSDNPFLCADCEEEYWDEAYSR